jgi:hypothetical protein
MNRKKLAVAIGTLTLAGAVALTGAALTAERPASAPKKAPTAKAPPAKTAPVLGHLEMRGRRITIKSGGLYTVTTRDGTVIGEDLTLEQLKAVDPSLKEQLERTVAGRRDGVMWAGK